MSNAIFPLAVPVNEPVRSYAPGSPEKKSLKQRLNEMASEQIEIPLIIGGKEVRTGDIGQAVCPHDHEHVLATYHQAGAAGGRGGRRGGEGGLARVERDDLGGARLVFLRAADLLAGPWRDTVNAATMLGQSKTVFQAEIDSACELIDFWRFNPYFMRHALHRAAVVAAPGSGTRWSTGRSRGSSSPSRRSTSPPSAATCRPRRR